MPGTPMGPYFDEREHMQYAHDLYEEEVYGEEVGGEDFLPRLRRRRRTGIFVYFVVGVWLRSKKTRYIVTVNVFTSF